MHTELDQVSPAPDSLFQQLAGSVDYQHRSLSKGNSLQLLEDIRIDTRCQTPADNHIVHPGLLIQHMKQSFTSRLIQFRARHVQPVLPAGGLFSDDDILPCITCYPRRNKSYIFSNEQVLQSPAGGASTREQRHHMTPKPG